MLGLSRTNTHKNNDLTSTTVMERTSSSDRHAMLTSCLSALLRNEKPDSNMLGHEDQKLLEELEARFWQSDRTALRGAVDTSMTASRIQSSISQAYHDISDVRTESQIMASAIQELESSFAQISESAQMIDTGLRNAAEETRLTAGEVDKATQSVRQTSENLVRIVDDMQLLEDAAVQIRSMSQTIEQIAGQTNLLALNATIEAARAGEAGRGFAVVASEVKSLSTQTAKTTEQIAERIQNLENAIETIVSAINEAQDSARMAETVSNEANQRVQNTTQSILSSSEQVSNLSHVIGDQKKATAELAKGVERIASDSNAAQDKLSDTVREAAASESVVNAQLAELELRRVPNYVLYRAKADHLLWKKKLAARLSGMSDLDEKELTDHHSCRLGKWWDREKSGPFGSMTAFKAIETPHMTVHRAGRLAAELCSKGDRMGATQAFTEMEIASEEVVQRLDAMIRAVESQG